MAPQNPSLLPSSSSLSFDSTDPTPPKGHFSEHFTDPQIDNLRVKKIRAVVYPQLIIEEFPLNQAAKHTIIGSRAAISEVMHGNDDRLIVVVGPCSIHDTAAALEYAELLLPQITRFSHSLVIVMRIYFEKPRTTVGWKGLINDPLLDSTCNINLGIRKARELLVKLSTMGIPCGTEFLDCLTPQFYSDTISWGAIGARTTESQLHRELASGLSMPIGFKNGTSGDVQIAIDALKATQHSHEFLSVTKLGTIGIVKTYGNHDCHVILRGGASGVNYHADTVKSTAERLTKSGLVARIMVDFSHGNSEKNYKNQAKVCDSICEQLSSSPHASTICGVMIESNLVEGNQSYTPGVSDKSALTYGVSITDGCVDWTETLVFLEKLSAAVLARRNSKK